ncbi:YVTN repeat-like/Quino protein amine dehydrogenase, partial [Saccharata proteae CBS 121410]
ERPRSINKEELQGNRYDMQGINWDRLETTRESARDARIKLYQCTRKRPTTTLSANRPYPLPNTENYFSFRRMNTNHKALISHFQLRNLIAATSRNDIFYASRSHVIRTDSVGLACDTVMDLNNDKTSMASIHSAPFDITSMTARDDILIAGGFRGEYALIDLSSPSTTKPHQGFVSHNYNAITNHIHLFPSRTSPHSAPLAAFSSNDASFRLLDTATQTFLRTTTYPAATNCTATSPDSRLRCVVGDFQDVLITDADTGRPFEAIPAHSDHAFACAWADDGILVATGAQDGNVVIHDARRWGRPLATLTSSMACPRSLHWSPVGGGKRVLVVAEADDIVRVVDARGWEKQQCLELFGTVAGVAVGQDGERIWVANADRRFGGIAEFERRGWA